MSEDKSSSSNKTLSLETSLNGQTSEPKSTLISNEQIEEVVSENSLFFTGNINEGFAYETIAESVLDVEPDEILIATPLEKFDTSAPSTSTYQSELLPEYNSSEEDNTYSDSDDLYPLFPESSSGEESEDSDITSLSDSGLFTTEMGNLPKLDKILDDKQEPKLRPSFNRSVSLPDPSPYKHRFGSIPYKVDPSTSFTPTQSFEDNNEITEVSSRSKDLKKKEILKTSGGTFCTTHTQSKLLGKLFDNKSETNISLRDEESDTFKKPLQTSPRRKHLKTATLTSKDINEKTVDETGEFIETTRAFEESVKEGTVLPLIKHELKMKIQVERLSRGEPELALEPNQPKQYELRPDEIIKKQRRLHQNRVSAFKSRAKARSHENILKQTIKNVMKDNAIKVKEVERLRELRDQLKEQLAAHKASCSVFGSISNVKPSE